MDAFSLLDIVEVSEAAGCSVEKAAEVYFALSEGLHVDMLLTRISALDRSDRWNALARSGRLDWAGGWPSVIARLSASQ